MRCDNAELVPLREGQQGGYLKYGQSAPGGELCAGGGEGAPASSREHLQQRVTQACTPLQTLHN